MQINQEQPGNVIRVSVIMGLILAIVIAGIVYNASLDKQHAFSNSGNKDTLVTGKTLTTNEEKKLFTVASVTDADTLSSLKSLYTINSLDTYEISTAEEMKYDVTVAKYLDEQGTSKQAIVYLPAKTDEKGKVLFGGDKVSHFRYEKWVSISDAIKKHTDEQALFVSFWDTGQRINLFTGRETWITLPDQNAYNSEEEQAMWKSIAGGFETQGRFMKYSKYLLLEKEVAITAIKKELPGDRDAYLVVSTDDLSHIQEVAILTKQGLPLETRVFPSNNDLHTGISKVKEWAKEGDGTGSYLAQAISEQSIRVWRITDKDFEDTLLARLLPFTSSLERPLEKNIKLVYQTDWGAFLSIYELTN